MGPEPSPELPSRTDVVVVGGGLAGLSAALRLRGSGRSVCVLEREDEPGGRVRAVRRANGHWLPRGPSSFTARYRAVWDFADAVGGRDLVRPVLSEAGARYVVREGRLHRLTPAAVLFGGALAPQARREILGEVFRPAGDPTGETVREFFVRRFGPTLADGLVAAGIQGVFAGSAEQLGVDACLPFVSALEREYGGVLRGAVRSLSRGGTPSAPSMATIEGGLGRLPLLAAKKVPVVCGVTVRSVEKTTEGWTVQVDGKSVACAAVVVATEAPVTAGLVRGVAPAAAELLGHFSYAPITMVHWDEDPRASSCLPRGFGFLAPPGEGLFSLGMLFLGDFLGGPRRFAAFVGGARQPARAALSDAELVTGLRADLRRLTGGTLSAPTHIQRWPGAVYQPPRDHAPRVAQLRESMAGSGLVLAGSYLGAAAMRDAIESGFQAADEVLSARGRA